MPEALKYHNGSDYVEATAASPYPIRPADSDILLPVDVQAIYRTQAFHTTSALGGGATYTGATLDGIQYRRLTGTVSADQAGTLHFEHSVDGSTWRRTRSISVAAGTPQSYDEPCYSRYVRAVYVNGATPQGSFGLAGFLSTQ